MRRHRSPLVSSSCVTAAFGACLVALCANGAVAAEPTAAAPAPASSSTQVTVPAGNPVVVVNTTVPASAPVVAPTPAPEAWIVPVQPAAAPAVPGRITVDVHPQLMATPTPAQIELSRRQAELSRARNLRIGGWVTVGSTYLLSALIGTVAIDTGNNRMRGYGYWMTVPVAGPFGAAFQTRSATGALLTTSLGIAQAAGLGMALVGGVRHRRLKRQLTFTAMPTRGGGHVGLSMRF